MCTINGTFLALKFMMGNKNSIFYFIILPLSRYLNRNKIKYFVDNVNILSSLKIILTYIEWRICFPKISL